MRTNARFSVVGLLTIVFIVSCSWMPFLGKSSGSTAPKSDPPLPPLPANWEKVLDLSTLPTLQDNLAGDADLAWIYANAVLGAEIWVMDAPRKSSPGTADIFESDPTLLQIPLTSTGWPRELPADRLVTLSSYYRLKAPPTSGQLRSTTTQSMTGLYVVTWKGKTLPDGQGQSQLRVLDTTNDGWNSDNLNDKTIVVPAGDHRMLALVRATDRGVNVQYRQPDPDDPIRDIKIWTPIDEGAGRDQESRLGAYNSNTRTFVASDLTTWGPGTLKAWCTEPGPSDPEPRWHPKYREHLRQDPSAVARFMGWLNINGLAENEPPLTWNDRLPEAFTLTSLVGVSPANYTRHPVTTFPSRCRVPYEWLFDLCNAAGKDCWLQVPHTATKEHIANLATLAQTRLDPSRRLWFEFSNELWNTYGPYLPQYRAAETEGSASGQSQAWGSGHLQGKALKTFEDAWARAGGSDDRLINVVGGFAISSSFNEEALKGAEAVSPGVAEVLAVTTYFGSELTDSLFKLDYGAGNPGEGVYLQAKELLRGSIYRDFEAWRADAKIARGKEVGLVAYEGGSHVLATGHGDVPNDPALNQKNQAFMTFLANLHQHQVMKDLYLEHWALWFAAGARTASLFVDIGGYGYFGYWGAKEDVTQTPDDSPRWTAAQEMVALQTGVRALGDPLGSAPMFDAVRSWRAEAALPFDETITAKGGDGALSTVLLGGTLPSGVSIDPASVPGTLHLTGTPTTLETARFVVRVTDRDGDPDYGIYTAVVDPAGTSTGRLVLFDPSTLPEAALAQSESREGYRSRFDDARSRMTGTDASGNPQTFLSFDLATPLYNHHYIDSSLTLDSTSAFAPSGGWTLTVMKAEFEKNNPGLWNADGALKNRIAWLGLRDKALTGWIGDSLETGGKTYGVPTSFDALLVWRKDQMGAAPGQTVTFGDGGSQASLILEFGGTSASFLELRFVIHAKDQNAMPHYYLSEAIRNDTAEGRFTLADFNDKEEAGKRWAEFHPETAEALSLPDASALTFERVRFLDVDGVGFALRTRATGWHYGLAVTRLLAVGVRAP